MECNFGRRGFSERMELDLDNIVVTGGFGLCISTSRGICTKKIVTVVHMTQALDYECYLDRDFRTCYYYEKLFTVQWIVPQITWHKYNADINRSLISLLPSGLGKLWEGHSRLPGEAEIIQKNTLSAFARTPRWVACRADSLQGKALVLLIIVSSLPALVYNLFLC